MPPFAQGFLALEPAPVKRLALFDLTGRHFDPLTASVFRFAFECGEKCARCGIQNAAVQAFLVLTATCGHVLDVELFGGDQPVMLNQSCSGLMQEVFAAVGDLAVFSGQRLDGFAPGVAMRVMDVIFQFLSACRLLRKP